MDISTGAAIINNFVDEKFLLDEIRGLTSSVMVPRPEYTMLNEFIKALRKYFQLKGITNPTVEQLVETAFGDRSKEVLKNPNNGKWLMVIWERPDTIPVIKTNQKVSKLPVYKEGSTWGHKRRKGAFISDSFGRSSEYNVERHVERKVK